MYIVSLKTVPRGPYVPKNDHAYLGSQVAQSGQSNVNAVLYFTSLKEINAGCSLLASTPPRLRRYKKPACCACTMHRKKGKSIKRHQQDVHASRKEEEEEKAYNPTTTSRLSPPPPIHPPIAV